MQVRRTDNPVLRAGAAKAALMASVALAGWAAAAGAHAQQGGAQLEEIVVTAERRATDLQRTALSVSAVSQGGLERAGVTDAVHLANAVPALTVITATGPYPVMTMRGIYSSAVNAYTDSSIVMNMDGVVLAHPSASHGLYYDLERVEVLKGPQGILYGRNATGGAINLISARPTFDFGGAMTVELGSYDKIQASGAVNIPLVADTLAARAAFQSVKQDGFYSDGTGDADVQAVRLSVRWEPHEDVSVLLRGDYALQGGKGPGIAAYLPRDNRTREGVVNTPGYFPYGELVSITDNPCAYTCPLGTGGGLLFSTPAGQARLDNKFWGVSAQVDWKTALGDLTLLGAYRRNDLDWFTVTTVTFATSKDDPRQYTLEARLVSPQDQRIRYQVGAFYLDDLMKAQSYYDSNTSGAAIGRNNISAQTINQTDKTWAAFGQLTGDVVEGLRLVAGVRYTWEEKGFNSYRYTLPRITPPAPFPVGCNISTTPPFSLNNPGCVAGPPFSSIPFPGQPGATSWTNTSWKVGFEWDPAPHSLIYGNVGTGFKAGGYFFGLPSFGTTYEPETVTAYTLGTKNRFLDGRLQANAELYYYKYKDQQVSYLAQASGTPLFATANAGDSTTKGVEVELQFLATDNTLLNFTAQWLDAKYDQLVFLQPNLGALPNSGCPITNAASAFPTFAVNCSGKDALFSPEWVFSGGVEQTFPLGNGASLVAFGTVRYTGERESSVTYLRMTKLDAYAVGNVGLTYNDPDDRWSATVFADNVTDERAISSFALGGIGPNGPFGAIVIPPRTYGVRVNAKFGG